MAAWSSLPPELTILVLSNLGAEEIRSCSTVSSYLRVLAEPFLYHSPFISRSGYDDSLDQSNALLRLLHLVRTIVSRPALGAQIQNLTVNSPGLDDGFSIDRATPVHRLNAVMSQAERTEALEDVPETSYAPRSDIDMLAKAAEAQGLSASLILRGGHAGQMVLLLHHLTRLKRLVVVTPGAMRPIADAALGRLQGGVPVGLRIAEQIRITDGGILHSDRSGDYHILSRIPLMALPNLVDLTINAFTDYGMRQTVAHSENEGESNSGQHSEKRNYLPVDPHTSTIQALTFVNSSITNSMLQQIMAIPRELKRFSYEIGERAAGNAFFIPKSVVQNLLPHAHHLTHLCLTEKNEITSHMDGSGMGSLKAFTVLRDLTAPATMLLGHPMNYALDSLSLKRMASTNVLDGIIPSSLVSLQCILNNWLFSNFLAVTGLPHTFGKTHDQCPSLKSFIIDREVPYWSWKRDSEESVRAAMKKIPGLSDLFISHNIVVIPPLPSEQRRRD